MITRVRAQNFKSLRNVDLELGARNVLVGPNMSGKSNIIDVFRFLTAMVTPSSGMHGLPSAFAKFGGFWELAWKGSDSPLIAVDLQGGAMIPSRKRLVEKVRLAQGNALSPQASPGVVSAQFDYGIELVGDNYGNARVQEERLVISEDGRRWEAIGKEQGVRALKNRGGRTFCQAHDPFRAAVEFSGPDWEAEWLRFGLASFRFYRLIPPLMKVINPNAAATFLTEFGDNLASWLMTLQTQHKECFARIESVMRDVFPDVESIFNVPTQQATVFVSSRERLLRRPTSFAQMSDGELAFLALLSLIYAPPELGAPLFCIEEPENHLHPRLLETLVQLLKQRQAELPESERATVVVSTHSALFIDQCELDEIIVVEKRDGATVCTRPRDKKHLRDLVERRELGLGDLYYSGALGGG